MNPIQAAILGFVQGATEFIPVSSSAHLVILPRLFNWAKPPMTFDIFVHFGTLLALIVYFWPEFVNMIKGIFSNPFAKPLPYATVYPWLLILAVVPLVIAKLLFSARIEASFEDPVMASWMLLGTAALLIIATYVKGVRKLESATWTDALVVGAIQAVAVLPGISRSGATITGARIMGFDREASAKFAFHIAIPAIGGAFALGLFEAFNSSMPVFWVPSIIGIVVAAVVGYLSLFIFFKFIKKIDFTVFAVYCIAFFLVCRLVMQ